MSGVAVRVRKAGVEDAAAIAGVHVRSWRAAYRGIVPDALLDGLSVAQREIVWRELLGRGDRESLTLVAEREGEVVGFCSILAAGRDGDAAATGCEVAAIYVDPRFWRAGVGRALLGAALDGAHDCGCDEATLWVFAANRAAIAFYEAFGFRFDGAEKLHERSGLPEVRMRASPAVAESR
jgi:GNAT superfamily N-acetyltransferase